MIFTVQTPFQKELYILELENGKEIQKGVVKCKENAQALFEGSVNKKYNYKNGYRSLWIFEYRSTMEAVISRL